jgi:RNA polymerase sigma-54 factor
MSPDMKMRQTLGQYQRMEQRLTPQLIQAVEMLQLPIMELSQKVEEILEENPFLELSEETGKGNEEAAELEEQEWVENPETIAAMKKEHAESQKVTEEPAEATAAETAPAETTTEQSTEDFSRVDNLESDEYFEHFRDNSYRGSLDEDPRWEALQNTPNLEESLYEHLQRQIELVDASPRIKGFAIRLASALDREGYLKTTPEEALAPTDEEVKNKSYTAPTPEEAQKALDVIRNLDPAGVGAKDLKDCLLLQMKSENIDDPPVFKAIEGHLDDLLHNRLPKVASDLEVSIGEVKRIVDVLRRFTPFPGRLYSQESTQYVKPDIVVRPDGDDYEVIVNESFLPAIRVSNKYKELLNSADEASKEFLRRKYQEARQLRQNIEQRRSTLYRIARKLTDTQKEFLEKGEAYLKPLLMQGLAEELNLHVSTVSRAVADKYIDTPAGVYPLRRFFSAGYTRSHAVADPEAVTELSNQAVMKMVREIVEQEDRRHPLADKTIAEMIKQRGINIARRTVAKYREKIGILPARQRRTY